MFYYEFFLFIGRRPTNNGASTSIEEEPLLSPSFHLLKQAGITVVDIDVSNISLCVYFYVVNRPGNLELSSCVNWHLK